MQGVAVPVGEYVSGVVPSAGSGVAFVALVSGVLSQHGDGVPVQGDGRPDAGGVPVGHRAGVQTRACAHRREGSSTWWAGLSGIKPCRIALVSAVRSVTAWVMVVVADCGRNGTSGNGKIVMG